jgi:hypothetical protein
VFPEEGLRIVRLINILLGAGQFKKDAIGPKEELMLQNDDVIP